VTEVVERFGMSRQAVHRWVRWYRDEGGGPIAARQSAVGVVTPTKPALVSG
jgi:transposase-like protein